MARGPHPAPASAGSMNPSPKRDGRKSTRSGPSACTTPRGRDRLGREQPHAVDLADKRRIEPRQRAGAHDAVRGRHLGAQDLRPVPHLVVGEEVRGPAPSRAPCSESAPSSVNDRRAPTVGRNEARRSAAAIGLGQADPEVEPERARDLVGEEAPERTTRHPPHDLAEDPAERAHVVAVRRARAPSWAPARRSPPRPGPTRAPRPG